MLYFHCLGNIIYFKVRLSALKGVLNIDFVDGLDFSDVTLASDDSRG